MASEQLAGMPPLICLYFSLNSAFRVSSSYVLCVMSPCPLSMVLSTFVFRPCFTNVWSVRSVFLRSCNPSIFSHTRWFSCLYTSRALPWILAEVEVRNQFTPFSQTDVLFTLNWILIFLLEYTTICMRVNNLTCIGRVSQSLLDM